LKKKNEGLQIQVDGLLSWKDNHNCRDNINTDDIQQNIYDKIYNEVKSNIKEIPEYIEISNLNKTYNEKLLKLESDMKGMQLNSNIEDDELFKQLKIQNNILLDSNKKLENNYKVLNVELKNIKDNKDYKINEALKKQKETLSQEYENNYSSNILSLNESIKCLQQTIYEHNKKNEELQKQLDEIKINNKKTKNENKSQDKYCEQNMYNSIFIYDDVTLPYQVYRASKTYRKLLDEIEFNNNIGDLNYDNIAEWINKNEKTNFKSNYFKNKYERSKLILDKYKDDLYKLMNLKFSISFISSMSENKFNDWLNILDDKFNSFYIN
jgi:hypothetical protein